MRKKQEQATELQVVEVSQGQLVMHVVGVSPLVMNRMSEKAKHELLMPRGRMTSYDKQVNQKHDPIAEFLAAPHRIPSGETLLAMPSTAFKGALSTAALDIPGAKKAQVARLTYVEGEYVGIYGIPKLYMATVRSSGMDHTPDIRTRVILAEWAAKFVVSYVMPLLQPNAIARLVSASGVYVGVGDGRPEKGKLSFGRFRVVHPDKDEDYKRIVKYGGRKLQAVAMTAAEPYDDESAEMLAYWIEEGKRRKSAQGAPAAKPNGKAGRRFEAPETAVPAN